MGGTIKKSGLASSHLEARASFISRPVLSRQVQDNLCFLLDLLADPYSHFDIHASIQTTVCAVYMYMLYTCALEHAVRTQDNNEIKLSFGCCI